jgi:flagellar protein FlaI
MKKERAKKEVKSSVKPNERNILDQYGYVSEKIPVTVTIYASKDSYVPLYDLSISSISPNTEIILEKIRKELIKEVNLGMVALADFRKQDIAQEKFKQTIELLIKKYFADANNETIEFLSTYLIQKSLGLGIIEILDDDAYLGRKVGRQISVLEPLMDANIEHGDRVNSTLFPISSKGNTITLRKYSAKPWTITDFIREKAISIKAAAFIWHCIQYELSTLIAGGTASGKTSMLNVVTNFFPPNQRIISIEDTREVELPKFLHWVPLVTRLPNPEGKGGITMLDLVVNSLRMRPDRIIVGEIRRKQEAEILFEAMHTGHSVFATIHANNTKETITRLASPPIEIPRSMLPAISLIVVQYRNRRTGLRRTFQISEILDDGSAHLLMQYDPGKDVLVEVDKSKSIMERLELYTGEKKSQIEKEIKDKEKILAWIAKQGIDDVEKVGRVIAEFYTRKENLMKHVDKGIPLG